MEDLNNNNNDLFSAKIGLIDFALLLLMAMMLTVMSVYNLGKAGFMAVMVIFVVVSLLKPTNTLLAWLTFLYAPPMLVGLHTFKITIVLSVILTALHGCGANLKGIFNKVGLVIFIFALYLLGPLVLSPNRSGAIATYWNLWKAFIIMFLFLNTITNEAELGRVLKWWAISAAISFVPSVVHYILGPNAWLYAAYAATGLRDVEIGMVLVETESVGRLLWAGVDANGRGATLLFPLGIALAFFSVTKGKQKIFWSVIMGLIVICIMGLFSRSTFISMVLVALVYALIANFRAIIPLSAGGLIGLVSIMFMPAIRDRIFSIRTSVVEEAGSGRLIFWMQALMVWLRSPLIGIGLRGAVVRIRAEVHSSYLSLLADTGIIGCGLFCLLIFMSCRWFLTAGKYRGSMYMNFGKILFCGMFGFCAMIGTVTFYTDKTLWMTFAVSFLFYKFQEDYYLGPDSLYIQEGNYQ